jgi:NADH-quinone oxidoreductase subunit C
MSQKLIDLLRSAKPKAVLGSLLAAGDATVIVARDQLLDVATFLRDDPRARFDVLVDVTAVDYSEYDPELRKIVTPLDTGDSAALPRFEVVYHLLSMPHKHRIRLKVTVAEDDFRVPSLTDLWISANWGEREAYDMFGVKFDGHPDLRRVLLYEEFVGHPLRKDFAQRNYQPLVPMPNLADYADNETYR